MRKLWHDEAWEEYLYWQSQDKKTLKKINRLLTDIDRNGYQCTYGSNDVAKRKSCAGDSDRRKMGRD